jgi:hypothetical protein
MAVRLFTDLKDLTFSRWTRPNDPQQLASSVLKFSIWSALGTGCVASVSAIFNRIVIERNAFAPSILKASLTSCATFTVFAAYIIYRLLQMPDEPTPNERRTFNQKVNADIAFLEIGAITACAAISPAIKTLSGYSIHPLFWIGMTMAATRLFHAYQLKQIGNI